MEEERNKIPEKVKICKISVKNNIYKEEPNNILEILRTPWSWNEWSIEVASENLKRHEEILMAAIRQNGVALKFASEDLQGDR